MIDLPTKPLAGQGIEVDNTTKIGGDFTLTDHNGNIFSSDSMKGKISLIYFGFTFCPDICPTSLQKLTTVVTTLDKYQISILPIFITVDPTRDTSKILKEYLEHFSPRFLGLTGSEQEINYVANLYKVFFTKAENTHTRDLHEYMIDHSSFIYIMDKNGQYLKHFYMSTEAEEIINFIRIYK